MSPDCIIGIDVGVRGGYCVIGLDGTFHTARNFPVVEKMVDNHRRGQKATRKDSSLDLESIASDLSWYATEQFNAVGYMELVHSRPHEGVATSFKFGLCRGQIEGIFATLRIPFITVTPREWQKELHAAKEMFDKVDAKTRSKNAYRRHIDPFGGDIHIGVIDATLIALYGQRRLAAGLDTWRFKKGGGT